MVNFNKKLGYYTCGGLEFESKIQACFSSLKTGQPVEWVFNDQEFKLHNWKIEPEETLDQLYNKRAKELREKYDYLMLAYSGGADSHNILTAFVRQGLVIDEIIINTVEKGWSSFLDTSGANTSSYNLAAEHYLQTMPRLKELENHLTKTKITVCDLTDYVFEYFSKDQDPWFLTKKESLNPSGISKYNYLYVSKVRKLIDKQKSIGLILGVDKPKAIIHQGKFYSRFTDRTANMVSITDHFNDYDNTTVEFFYWSPECVPLLIKQAHVLKKWLEATPNMQKHWDGQEVDFKTIRIVHEQAVRQIIYSTWNNAWFQVDKAVKDWYSEFDTWFIQGFKDTKAVYNWQQGINFIESELAQFTKIDNETQKKDGLKVFQKYYLIGNFNYDLRN